MNLLKILISKSYKSDEIKKSKTNISINKLKINEVNINQVKINGVKINGLSNLIKTNDIISIENGSFFYINCLEKLIPWYNVFHYYFYNINNKLFIDDYDYKHIIDDYFKNKVTNENHIDLLNNKNFNKIYKNKVFFITHTLNNGGHSLSSIFHSIYLYLKNNLYDYEIIVTNELMNFNTFMKSIIYYFFDESKITIIDNKTVVYFNYSYIYKNSSGKDIDSISYLINKLKLNNKEYKKYDNICLIKTFDTQNFSNNRSFSNDYNDFIKNKNFDIIIPENYELGDLFNIIYNSKNIIMSWGCCSYLNSIFVNESSNVLVLCHENYQHEYKSLDSNFILQSGWFPTECNKKLIMYDLKTELNDDIKILLDNTIDKLVL